MSSSAGGSVLPLLQPSPGLGQFLHKTHNHFFAVAFPMLPIMLEAFGIAGWKTLRDEGRCRVSCKPRATEEARDVPKRPNELDRHRNSADRSVKAHCTLCYTGLRDAQKQLQRLQQSDVKASDSIDNVKGTFLYVGSHYEPPVAEIGISPPQLEISMSPVRNI